MSLFLYKQLYGPAHFPLASSYTADSTQRLRTQCDASFKKQRHILLFTTLQHPPRSHQCYAQCHAKSENAPVHSTSTTQALLTQMQAALATQLRCCCCCCCARCAVYQQHAFSPISVQYYCYHQQQQQLCTSGQLHCSLLLLLLPLQLLYCCC
jgi:hypothetical protein